MAREQPHRRQLLPLFLEIPKGNDGKNVRRVVTFRSARVSKSVRCADHLWSNFGPDSHEFIASSLISDVSITSIFSSSLQAWYVRCKLSATRVNGSPRRSVDYAIDWLASR